MATIAKPRSGKFLSSNAQDFIEEPAAPALAVARNDS